jgi:hypothetical protein
VVYVIVAASIPYVLTCFSIPFPTELNLEKLWTKGRKVKISLQQLVVPETKEVLQEQ